MAPNPNSAMGDMPISELLGRWLGRASLNEVCGMPFFHDADDVCPLNLVSAQRTIRVGRQASGIRFYAGYGGKKCSAVGLRSQFRIQMKSTRFIGGRCRVDGVGSQRPLVFAYLLATLSSEKAPLRPIS